MLTQKYVNIITQHLVLKEYTGNVVISNYSGFYFGLPSEVECATVLWGGEKEVMCNEEENTKLGVRWVAL